MATPQREQLAKQFLQAQVGGIDGHAHHASKPTYGKPTRVAQGSGRPVRHHKIPHRLSSPTGQQLERREQGWNDRFTRDPTPTQLKRPIRTHREVDDASDSQTQKERKIREERHQYGHGHNLKHQRPGVGRLVPIGSLALPPREPETTSSKEEKLRFSILKAIDVRETLVYQLNALILCTPVQEEIVMAASRVSNGGHPQIKPRSTMAIAPSVSVYTSGSAMSNSREAMRLAQQLSADLQIAGIHVVEGIVEWMLEAGAKADKPPEFLWRGRNYFAKMLNDLDFASPELHARGVELDCFTVANPLCVRPDQKLGRVLAAQSIIKDLAEIVGQELSTPTQEEGSSSGRDRRKASGRKTKPSDSTPRHKVEEQPSSPVQIAAIDTIHQSQLGADEMIMTSDDYEDDKFPSARSAGTEIAVPSMSMRSLDALRDLETEKELVSILDESFCEAFTPTPAPEPQTDTLPRVSGMSVTSSSRDEYEKIVNVDEGEESPPKADLRLQEEHEGEAVYATDADQKVPDSNDHDVEIVDDSCPEEQDLPSENKEETGGSKNELLEDEPKVNDREAAVWDRAAVLLSLKVPALDKISGTALKEWAGWTNTRRQQLHAVVSNQSWAEAQSALTGSLLDGLGAAWSSKATLYSMATSLKIDEDLVEIKLAESLWEECQVIIDELCGGLAHVLQNDLAQISRLVSEVDFADLLEAAVMVLDRNDVRNVLLWVSRATDILLALHPSPRTQPFSVGLSNLLRIFYPYLMNQSRDKLVQNWHQISRLFVDKCNIRIDELSLLLDPPCKILFLNVTCLRRFSLEADEGDTVSIPKLSIVCDRANLLESSIEATMKKCFASNDGSNKQLPSYLIFPFFQSSFGEKIVDGVRVEEGEGKGPLKEWFTLIANDLIAKWSKIELPAGVPDDFGPVLVNDNKLVVDRLHDWLKPGYKLQWRSPCDGTMISRIVNMCDPSNGAYMLDRGGISSQSFNFSELCVFQPRTAYLEYIQASESYWLNDAAVDSPANHQAFDFIGWFLANALVHQCALQRRLHPLLFELLLDEHRVITLPDLQSLDPTLYAAMEQLQRMKPAEFASYVEFEGFSPLLSVDEYSAHTIDAKYGAKSSIAWQLRAMRRGFHRVFSLHDLCSCNVLAVDLSEHLSGANHNSTDADFDFDDVFCVSLDPDFASCEPLQRGFWAAVNGFNPSLKRKLVKFITGVDTLPQAGVEFLRLEMPFPAVSSIDCEKTLRMLPQSHTCDNTLELPHYWRALCWKHKHEIDRPNESLEAELFKLLSEKLRLAAEYSSGYGLDGTTSAGHSLAGILPGSLSATRTTGEMEADQLDIQDSYESLNLPGLGGDSIAEAGESRTETQPQADEQCSLETSETRQHVATQEELPAMTDQTPDEEDYGAEEWDVEEEVAE